MKRQGECAVGRSAQEEGGSASEEGGSASEEGGSASEERGSASEEGGSAIIQYHKMAYLGTRRWALGRLDLAGLEAGGGDT